MRNVPKGSNGSRFPTLCIAQVCLLSQDWHKLQQWPVNVRQSQQRTYAWATLLKMWFPSSTCDVRWSPGKMKSEEIKYRVVEQSNIFLNIRVSLQYKWRLTEDLHDGIHVVFDRGIYCFLFLEFSMTCCNYSTTDRKRNGKRSYDKANIVITMHVAIHCKCIDNEYSHFGISEKKRALTYACTRTGTHEKKRIKTKKLRKLYLVI